MTSFDAAPLRYSLTQMYGLRTAPAATASLPVLLQLQQPPTSNPGPPTTRWSNPRQQPNKQHQPRNSTDQEPEERKLVDTQELDAEHDSLPREPPAPQYQPPSPEALPADQPQRQFEQPPVIDEPPPGWQPVQSWVQRDPPAYMRNGPPPPGLVYPEAEDIWDSPILNDESCTSIFSLGDIKQAEQNISSSGLPPDVYLNHQTRRILQQQSAPPQQAGSDIFFSDGYPTGAGESRFMPLFGGRNPPQPQNTGYRPPATYADQNLHVPQGSNAAEKAAARGHLMHLLGLTLKNGVPETDPPAKPPPATRPAFALNPAAPHFSPSGMYGRLPPGVMPQQPAHGSPREKHNYAMPQQQVGRQPMNGTYGPPAGHWQAYAPPPYVPPRAAQPNIASNQEPTANFNQILQRMLAQSNRPAQQASIPQAAPIPAHAGGAPVSSQPKLADLLQLMQVLGQQQQQGAGSGQAAAAQYAQGARIDTQLLAQVAAQKLRERKQGAAAEVAELLQRLVGQQQQQGGRGPAAGYRGYQQRGEGSHPPMNQQQLAAILSQMLVSMQKYREGQGVINAAGSPGSTQVETEGQGGDPTNDPTSLG